jgi:uncharacterized protein (TIRG00374 family)
LKQNLSKALKLILSLGLGVFLIAFFYHSISKPKTLLLDKKKYPALDYKISKVYRPLGGEVLLGDTLFELQSNAVTSFYLAETEARYLVVAQTGAEINHESILGSYQIDLFKIIKKVFRSASWFWLVLSLIASLLGHVMRSLRWRMMLQSMGYEPKMYNTFFAVVIMYMANMALPRLGEVMRCEVIRRYENIPLEKSLGSMLTERLIDVLCLLVLALIMICFQYTLIYNFFKDQLLSSSESGNHNGLFIKVMFVVVLLVALVFVFIRYIKNGQSKFALKIKSIVLGLVDGILSVKNVQNKFLFILYTVSIWTTYVLTVYFCLKAVPETSISTINTAITCLFFGSLAIVAVQGGLGVYPLVIGKVLLLYNITESIGYANGWLSWIVQTALILVLGFICMILINVMNKDTKSVDISNQ